MRSRFLFIIMGVIILLTACNDLTKEEAIEKMQNKVDDIKTYQCRVEVEVFGNKGSQLYEMRQLYKEGAFRLETMSPKHLTGKIVIIKNGKAKIYHPTIKQSIIIDDFRQNYEETMFLGDFMDWNIQEFVEFEKITEKNQDYLILKKDIKQDCFYHDHLSLWIDKKTLLPRYMKIYDQKNRIRVEISIFDLEINKDIEEALFIIDEEDV